MASKNRLMKTEMKKSQNSKPQGLEPSSDSQNAITLPLVLPPQLNKLSGSEVFWQKSAINYNLTSSAPASLEPEKSQRCKGPVWPETWQSFSANWNCRIDWTKYLKFIQQDY